MDAHRLRPIIFQSFLYRFVEGQSPTFHPSRCSSVTAEFLTRSFEYLVEFALFRRRQRSPDALAKSGCGACHS